MPARGSPAVNTLVVAIGTLLAWTPMQAIAAPGPAEGQPAHEPRADRCDALLEEWDALLAAAPGACKTDAECAFYGDIRMAGKMGVTDRTTAMKLERVSRAYGKRSCPTACAQSGPVEYRARCLAGSCSMELRTAGAPAR